MASATIVRKASGKTPPAPNPVVGMRPLKTRAEFLKSKPRRYGRTTAWVLETLAVAIRNPGRNIQIREPQAKETAENRVFLMRRLMTAANSLGLRDLTIVEDAGKLYVRSDYFGVATQ